MLRFKCSQLPDICNLWRAVVSRFWRCSIWGTTSSQPLLSLTAPHSPPRSVSQTESPRTGRQSSVPWSTWSTTTTSATRRRRETPCEGRLTGKCTTSGYPSLRGCRRMTPASPSSECGHIDTFDISLLWDFDLKFSWQFEGNAAIDFLHPHCFLQLHV